MYSLVQRDILALSDSVAVTGNIVESTVRLALRCESVGMECALVNVEPIALVSDNLEQEFLVGKLSIDM